MFWFLFFTCINNDQQRTLFSFHNILALVIWYWHITKLHIYTLMNIFCLVFSTYKMLIESHSHIHAKIRSYSQEAVHRSTYQTTFLSNTNSGLLLQEENPPPYWCMEELTVWIPAIRNHRGYIFQLLWGKKDITSSLPQMPSRTLVPSGGVPLLPEDNIGIWLMRSQSRRWNVCSLL